MSARRLLVTVTAVTLLGPVAAQPPKNGPNPAKAELKLREDHVLKEVYILMAAANADYDGHRAKAMREVEAAFRALDNQVAKAGTAQQKAIASQEDIAAYRAKFVAQHAPKVKEPQALSDLLMRQALALLAQVRPVLVQNKQPQLVKRVDAAGKQIQIALAIR